MEQYIRINCRPDVCANVQLIAPGSEPNTDAGYNPIMETVKQLKDKKQEGFNFVKIDLETARIVLLTETSFANEREMKSQLAFLVLMMEASGKAIIIHYRSTGCQRVIRSVMESDIHVLVLGFDYAYIIKDMIRYITRRYMPVEAFVDRLTLLDVIGKDGLTTELRLQIDIFAFR